MDFVKRLDFAFDRNINITKIRQLINNVNVVDIFGTSLLYHAVFYNLIDIVNFVLANDNVDVNIKNRNISCLSPLHAAILGFDGNMEIIKLLLAKKGIDVNIENNFGNTPLHYACSHGYIEIVKCLITAEGGGADINKQNDSGNNPLHYSVHNNDLAISILLLEYDSDIINVKNNENQTPLDIANRFCSSAFIDKLTEQLYVTYKEPVDCYY